MSVVTGGSRRKAVDRALQPTNVSMGQYGSITGDRKNLQFNFNNSPWQQATRNNTDQKISSLVDGMPTGFTPDDMWNNVFANEAARVSRANLEDQWGSEDRQMMDSLAARNQLGGSFEAMLRRDAMKRRNLARMQSDLASRQQGSDAFMQALQGRLGTLGALRADRGAAINQDLAPMQLALSAMGLGSNLGSQYANYRGNESTWMDAYQKWINTNANAMRAAGGM